MRDYRNQPLMLGVVMKNIVTGIFGELSALFKIGLMIAILFLPLAAWLTHIYVCFVGEKWGFLIAGAIMFPIAIVHGIGIWFGVW